MEMRWLTGAVGIGFGLCLSITPAMAASDSTAEAAPVEGRDAGVEQIRSAIEATRQTDPELAKEMETQLHLMETGQISREELTKDAQGHEGSRESQFSMLQAGGTSSGSVGSLQTDVTGGAQARGGIDRRMIGPPVDMGKGDGGLIGPPHEGGSNGNPKLKEVESDPRMQELRQQVESGQLSEGQARERVFEVLRDHGVEPNNEREWERGAGNGQDAVGRESERGQGTERGMERMAPQAREQMERSMGHESQMERSFSQEREQTGSDRGASERELGSHERASEGGSERGDREMNSREVSSFERSHETSGRESQPQEREHESFQREAPQFEAPQHEAVQHETPQIETPQHEAPQIEAPQHDIPQFEAPQHEVPQYEQQPREVPQYEQQPH